MIINQIVKGGGGSAPAHYVEFVNDNGTLKYKDPNNLDFSGITTVPTNMFYDYKNRTQKVSGYLNFHDVTSVGGYAFRDSFEGSDITFVDFGSLETLTGNYAFENAFRNNKIVGFDFSKLKSITQNNAFANTFANNTTLVGVFSFPSLEIIYYITSCFYGCTGITFFGFPKAKVVGKSTSSAAMSGCFFGCTSLVAVNMNAVESFASNYDGLFHNAFSNTGLQKIRFPMLTVMPSKTFGPNGFGTAALTEIHFRKDMQATVESLDYYSTKWGATNATVYFDLVGTLTGADGNTYTRDEYNSVYSDQHGQFQTAVAWKYNDTTYYTPFSANEPAVGDTIYSDSACTTAVTTIATVA